MNFTRRGNKLLEKTNELISRLKKNNFTGVEAQILFLQKQVSDIQDEFRKQVSPVPSLLPAIMDMDKFLRNNMSKYKNKVRAKPALNNQEEILENIKPMFKKKKT